MNILVLLTTHWATVIKAIEYFEKQLKIAIEIGDGTEEEIKILVVLAKME